MTSQREEGTVGYGVFLEREVTVAFTTPRTSIQHIFGCRGANRTLIASFKDSRPAIERPGIAPPFTPFKHTNSFVAAGSIQLPSQPCKDLILAVSRRCHFLTPAHPERLRKNQTAPDFLSHAF